MEKKVEDEFTEDDLVFIYTSCFALLQNISEQALPTYCGYTKQEVIEFIDRCKIILQENNIEL